MATEGERYTRLFTHHGLRVEEKKGKQKTLLGGEVDYHTVTGIREGNYRVTVHLKPGPTRAQIVIHASSGEKARRAATKLRELGFRVEVEEERVSGTLRGPDMRRLKSAIDAAEEATKK